MQGGLAKWPQGKKISFRLIGVKQKLCIDSIVESKINGSILL